VSKKSRAGREIDPDYVEHDLALVRQHVTGTKSRYKRELGELLAEIAPGALEYPDIEARLGWPARRVHRVIGGLNLIRECFPSVPFTSSGHRAAR
jgi:hypothetical protein